MTKKHFEALADELYCARPDWDQPAMLTQWRRDFCAVTNVCRDLNPRFDSIRFSHRAHFGHDLTQTCCPKGG